MGMLVLFFRLLSLRPLIQNVAILNATTQKADRVGYQIDENGVKTRVYKSNGESVATAK